MTKVSAVHLARFQANRAARRALEGVPGASSDLTTLKNELKTLWASVRRTHGVPKATKLAIELDGSTAGTLKIKGTGRAWSASTPAQPAVRGCTSVADGSVVVINADNTAKVFSNANAGREYSRANGLLAVHAVVG